MSTLSITTPSPREMSEATDAGPRNDDHSNLRTWRDGFEDGVAAERARWALLLAGLADAAR